MTITSKRFRVRNRFILAGDLFFIVIAVLGSFVLRLELGASFISFFPQAIRMTLIALVIKPVVYYFFGLYRRLWAYASIRELIIIAAGVTTASTLVSVAVIAMTSLQAVFPDFVGFPRLTLAIDWLLSMIFVGGLRFIFRLMAEGRVGTSSMNAVKGEKRQVLIVGAGDAGALVAREIQRNPQINLDLNCFLDDDVGKRGQQIHGVPVVGAIDDLSRVATRRGIQEVIMAIPTASGDLVRKVADHCRKSNIPFRTMPGIYELIGGKVSVSRLRDVNIDDLLRRESVTINNKQVSTTISGKRVLITGAGGSIGLELCKQIARWGPSSLLLLGHGENSIFETVLDLTQSYPTLPIIPLVADIRDQDRIGNIFSNHLPQVVFHTAAHKHVPLMEVNIEEAVTNNILGTRNILDVCINFDIERFVLISTDKAIMPTSIMGATKRMSELLVIHAARNTERAYSIVRFGNVLGSRGSVVPRFARQIEYGGPVTVTHPDMERYFMTIPEAVHLVLQAASMGKGGEVFVLNMGEQIKVLGLAEDMIRLAGLEPNRDIHIEFTGIREGEKLSEELWDKWAKHDSTSHPSIYLLEDEDFVTGNELDNAVEEIISLAREGNPVKIKQYLDNLIPGSSVRTTPPPDITSMY